MNRKQIFSGFNEAATISNCHGDAQFLEQLSAKCTEYGIVSLEKGALNKVPARLYYVQTRARIDSSACYCVRK